MKVKAINKYFVMGIIAILTAVVFIAIITSTAFAKTNPKAEVKRAVPFSEVDVNDGFMRNYMKLVICEVIPTAIENVEKPNGGIDNIKNCAIWHRGGEKKGHEGALYVDSDVHKVLESMCMALDTPSGGDKEIEAKQEFIRQKLEEWIPYYIDAPEKEGSQYPGYFDTFWSLDEGYEKYSDTNNHELYCQGHFIEAAVAHYRYSYRKNPENPDIRLLKVAINSADHIVKTFGYGEGQRIQIPGHEEIELALIKLAKLCNEIGTEEFKNKANNYIDKAEFFLEARGHDYEKRTADNIILGKREYDQDHKPVREQTEAVGHAVRAQYMYTGMCELASIRPEYADKYNNALTSLWDSLTNTKQYVTGGIGDDSNHNEGFNEPYFLPNYRSYCETCAGVANMLWNRSMSTLYDGSKYADQVETDLYNNVLGCINFDGNMFYYQNKINTLNGFDRSQWFGTACCPPNYTRTILQTGGYIYNTTSNDIYINQYISNNAKFSFGENTVNINMKSNFPYDTKGSITIKPDKDGNFKVSLRNPSWSDGYTIKVDGKAVQPTENDGYLVISGHTWKSETPSTIEFEFNMSLKYIKTDERVEANQGLIALRRGPIVYCAEACDNEETLNINKSSVDPNGKYNFEYVESLDGKDNHYGVRSVYILNHTGKYAASDGIKDINWKFIPYYARNNRKPCAMQVFVFDGSNPLKTHLRAAAGARSSADMGPYGLNDGTNDDYMRWTNYGDDTPNPWVTYEFDTPVKFKGFRIWWYSSNSVRPADHFEIQVYNKQDNSCEMVTISNEDAVKYSQDDKFVTYEFPKTYEGNIIKMTLFNTYVEDVMKYVGINEWELIDADDTNTLTNIDITKQPTKTEYELNENFDSSGMIVTATYKDQTGKTTTKEVNGYSCSPTKLDKLGQQEITVTYTEGNITKTAKLVVNVKESEAPVTPSSNPVDNQTNANNTSAPTGDNTLLYLFAFLTIISASVLTLKLKKN